MSTTTLTLTEAVRHFSDYVSRVACRHESFVLCKGKKPVAATAWSSAVCGNCGPGCSLRTSLSSSLLVSVRRPTGGAGAASTYPGGVVGCRSS